MKVRRKLAAVLVAFSVVAGALAPLTVAARYYFWAVSGRYYEQAHYGNESVDYIKISVEDSDWYQNILPCIGNDWCLLMDPITVWARAYGDSVMAGFQAYYKSPYGLGSPCDWRGLDGRVMYTFTAASGYIAASVHPYQTSGDVCRFDSAADLISGLDVIGGVCADSDWCNPTYATYLEKGPYQALRSAAPGTFQAWGVFHSR